MSKKAERQKDRLIRQIGVVGIEMEKLLDYMDILDAPKLLQAYKHLFFAKVIIERKDLKQFERGDEIE